MPQQRLTPSKKHQILTPWATTSPSNRQDSGLPRSCPARRWGVRRTSASGFSREWSRTGAIMAWLTHLAVRHLEEGCQARRGWRASAPQWHVVRPGYNRPKPAVGQPARRSRNQTFSVAGRRRLCAHGDGATFARPDERRACRRELPFVTLSSECLVRLFCAPPNH